MIGSCTRVAIRDLVELQIKFVEITMALAASNITQI